MTTSNQKKGRGRKSPFAGQSPVLATVAKSTDEPGAEVTPARADQAKDDVVKRWTIRVPVSLIGKARTAWLLDGVPRGTRNLSAWVTELVQAEVDRLEAAHGPLEDTPPGHIPQGWDAH